MRNLVLRRALHVATLASIVAAAAAVGDVAGCSDTSSSAPVSTGDEAPAPLPTSAAATTRLRAVHDRFPRGIDQADLARLEAGQLGELRSTGGHVGVELPADASGEVRLTDHGSGVALSFTLEGAAHVPVATAEGLAVYPQAGPSGGDIVHRVTAAGTEDFVFFARSPAQESLRYRLDVRHAAGLRLVGRTLEILDPGGAPRLRVAPPDLVDASGRHLQADLTVEGCAADTSPRAPWGRPVVKPGASSCTVVVAWAGRGVTYPALVDPAWVSTKSMVVERSHHALAMLPNPATPPGDGSPVLVTGGFDKNNVPLTSAEIYEPLSRTFAATGSMAKPRAGHTATGIAVSPTGHVLVAGGAASLTDPTPPEKLAIVSLSDAATTEIYSVQNGTFVLGPAMGTPRFHHTATALVDGTILLAGGISDQVNQPTKAADIFSFNPALNTGSIAAAAGTMALARSAHAATLLANGDVLVTGGVGTASFALLSAEIYCAGGSCAQGVGHFTQLISLMTAPRAFHTAVTLSSGDVLVAGGVNSVQTPISYLATADLYSASGGAFQSIAMSSARAFHTATLLSPAAVIRPDPSNPFSGAAEVILAGGFDGSSDLASVEAYFSATKTILPLLGASMTTSRRHARAALVNAGGSVSAGRSVLVTGGVSGSTTVSGTLNNGTATRKAEVLAKSLGEACAAAGECLSGFCADAVCCDKACTEDCFSCVAVKKEGNTADGTCGPTTNGTALPQHCYDDNTSNQHVEVHPYCDGAGHAVPGLGTVSCFPGVCGSATQCSTFCDPLAGCASTGWCDLGSPPGPDAGAPDAGGPYGTCQPKKDVGIKCVASIECLKGHCVDGYCCESACTEQCQACDVAGSEGKCTRIGEVESNATPHLNSTGDDGGAPRAMCNGQGTACGGLCGSMNVTSCDYPDAGHVEKSDDCTDKDGVPSTLVHHPCDTDGGSFDTSSTCAGYRCQDPNACKTTCSRTHDAGDSDCIQDFICDQDGGPGSCIQLGGPLCDGVDTLRQPADAGGYQKCSGSYACPIGNTSCLTSCKQVEDCVDGFVCQPQDAGPGRCVKPDDVTPPETPSCSAGGTPVDHGSIPWAAAALGALAVAARRRRRR